MGVIPILVPQISKTYKKPDYCMMVTDQRVGINCWDRWSTILSLEGVDGAGVNKNINFSHVAPLINAVGLHTGWCFKYSKEVSSTCIFNPHECR